MENKSLFAISKEYIELNERIMDAEGILDNGLSEELAINQAELQTKAVNYSYVIKKNEAECTIIDEEIKRLTHLKRVRENACNRLKEYVSEAMKLYEVDKIETPLMKLSFRKSVTTEISDLEILPSTFINTKIVRTADKKLIKEAIERGEIIEGAYLQEHKTLQIK